MNTNTTATQEETKVYEVAGMIMTEAQYRVWLEIRRGGSGF